MKMGKSH